MWFSLVLRLWGMEMEFLDMTAAPLLNSPVTGYLHAMSHSWGWWPFWVFRCVPWSLLLGLKETYNCMTLFPWVPFPPGVRMDGHGW